MPSHSQARIMVNLLAGEQHRIVAEAAQMEAVRALLPRFEVKIQRVLDRVWGNTTEATE